MPEYVGQFSSALQDESEPFGFDFRRDLVTSETIQTVTFNMMVIDGLDISPNSHFVGNAVISGTKVSQRVFGLLPGVTYALYATIVTNQANTKTLWGRVTCKG